MWIQPSAGARVSKIGLHVATYGLLAADHHAVPFLPAPDSAAGADVEEADLAAGQALRATNRVFVVAVAAIDDQIARLQQLGQIGDDPFGGVAAGTITRRPAAPVSLATISSSVGTIVTPLMSIRSGFGSLANPTTSCPPLTDPSGRTDGQAEGHVSAHFSESDKAELHSDLSLLVQRATARRVGRRAVVIRMRI